jgi:hypothetical protein
MAIYRSASHEREVLAIPGRRVRDRALARRLQFSAPHQWKGCAERQRGFASVVIEKARTPVRKFGTQKRHPEEPHTRVFEEM